RARERRRAGRDALFERLKAREGLDGVLVEELALWSQSDASPIAREERPPELGLEPLDRSRQRREADVTLTARAREVQGSGEVHEEPKSVVVHRHGAPRQAPLPISQ